MRFIQKEDYTPIPGFFDLSNLELPAVLFSRYTRLQRLAAHYGDTAEYNNTQFQDLKELVAEMNFDLIKNYNALELHPAPAPRSKANRKRNRDEIRNYLLAPAGRTPAWDCEEPIFQKMIDTGEMLEEKYFIELHGDGPVKYGYAMYCDFTSIPDILEDNAILTEVETFLSGIVLYSINTNTPGKVYVQKFTLPKGRRAVYDKILSLPSEKARILYDQDQCESICLAMATFENGCKMNVSICFSSNGQRPYVEAALHDASQHELSSEQSVRRHIVGVYELRAGYDTYRVEVREQPVFKSPPCQPLDIPK